MTTTYTNLTLLDIEQGETAEWLRENGYIAVVSPTVDDITVVYDNVLVAQDEADEPLEALLKLTSEMSYEFGCAVWLVVVDGGVLVYSLYIDGELADSYGTDGQSTSDGGDAELLADTFGVPKRKVKLVRKPLNQTDMSGIERHRKLLAELELPLLAAGASYESVMGGTLPEGVDNLQAMLLVDGSSVSSL